MSCSTPTTKGPSINQDENSPCLSSVASGGEENNNNNNLRHSRTISAAKIAGDALNEEYLALIPAGETFFGKAKRTTYCTEGYRKLKFRCLDALLLVLLSAETDADEEKQLTDAAHYEGERKNVALTMKLASLLCCGSDTFGRMTRVSVAELELRSRRSTSSSEDGGGFYHAVPRSMITEQKGKLKRNIPLEDRATKRFFVPYTWFTDISSWAELELAWSDYPNDYFPVGSQAKSNTRWNNKIIPMLLVHGRWNAIQHYDGFKPSSACFAGDELPLISCAAGGHLDLLRFLINGYRQRGEHQELEDARRLTLAWHLTDSTTPKSYQFGLQKAISRQLVRMLLLLDHDDHCGGRGSSSLDHEFYRTCLRERLGFSTSDENNSSSAFWLVDQFPSTIQILVGAVRRDNTELVRAILETITSRKIVSQGFPDRGCFCVGLLLPIEESVVNNNNTLVQFLKSSSAVQGRETFSGYPKLRAGGKLWQSRMSRCKNLLLLAQSRSMFNLLLEFGADINEEVEELHCPQYPRGMIVGRTLLEMALHRGDRQHVLFLISKGARLRSKWSLECFANDQEVIEALKSRAATSSTAGELQRLEEVLGRNRRRKTKRNEDKKA